MLVASDAPAREILTEWARLGGATIVNGDAVGFEFYAHAHAERVVVRFKTNASTASFHSVSSSGRRGCARAPSEHLAD